jgi:hypothetical protein
MGLHEIMVLQNFQIARHDPPYSACTDLYSPLPVVSEYFAQISWSWLVGVHSGVRSFYTWNGSKRGCHTDRYIFITFSTPIHAWSLHKQKTRIASSLSQKTF